VSPELRAIQTNFGWLVLLQMTVLAALVFLWLQIGGVPSQTAGMVPPPDYGTTTQIEFQLDPIGTNVTALQSKVVSMAAEIYAICTAVEKTQPAASPNPCVAP
jgi:hypothetical protein